MERFPVLASLFYRLFPGGAPERPYRLPQILCDMEVPSATRLCREACGRRTVCSLHFFSEALSGSIDFLRAREGFTDVELLQRAPKRVSVGAMSWRAGGGHLGRGTKRDQYREVLRVHVV
ncbi:hypothetical protein EVAR_10141_1 [Eumeta japonica]|uniref:Uncharacterized protein n=1 Tax=Eumeta variegata TaxID=151549 RepID=A0A4C1UD37_EUMVA|nr:hypothetical protein EVAR_10141_1 [Eumeta japonica]